jgi:hypothetical protein
MKIKVTSNKLPGAIALANGKCTAHTARLSDFLGSALRAEMELADLKLPKKRRIGAEFVFESGNKLPSSYKYRRTITRARLVRGARDWFVTSICTVEVWPSCGGGSLLSLTQSQADCVVSEFRQKFRVIEKPTSIEKTLLPDGSLLVHAKTSDNRHLVVVWHDDGTGYPVTDELTDAESDAVWAVASAEFKKKFKV